MTSPLVTILDDEPEIRRILTETLEDAGFRTQSFGQLPHGDIRLRVNSPLQPVRNRVPLAKSWTALRRGLDPTGSLLALHDPNRACSRYPQAPCGFMARQALINQSDNTLPNVQ